MQKSTNSKQKDTLHTQTNVNETHSNNSSTELIERIKIENTPFTFIRDKNTGKEFLTIGDYRLTENLNEIQEPIEEYIEKNKWILTMQMIGIAIEKVNKGEWQFHKGIPKEDQEKFNQQ